MAVLNRTEGEATNGSEARYRGLLEAAPDAMVVVDQAGEIVLLNLQAEKQFGYQRDELVGQQVTNIIPEGFAERLIADDLRSGGRRPGPADRDRHRALARRKDGSEFPIEIMLSPLESADGILVTAAIRDISGRKAADGTSHRWRAGTAGCWRRPPTRWSWSNQAGEIVLLNLQAEKQFGYHRDELVGQQVTNIIPEGFAERLIADDLRSAEDALAQQIGTGIELSPRRKDGSEFPIEIMLSPLESADGILVTAAIRDISRPQGRREPAAPGPEARIDRTARRRHRPRLQQHALRDPRLRRAPRARTSPRGITIASIPTACCSASMRSATRRSARPH